MRTCPTQIILCSKSLLLCSSVCLIAIDLNARCSFTVCSLVCGGLPFHIDWLCASLTAILAAISSLSLLSSTTLLLYNLLFSKAISDDTDTVFDANWTVFYNLLLWTKTSCHSISVFWTETILNWSGSLSVGLLWFPRFSLSLLLMRSFHKGTIGWRRISNEVLVLSLVTPTIYWIIFNYFCKWILL